MVGSRHRCSNSCRPILRIVRRTLQTIVCLCGGNSFAVPKCTRQMWPAKPTEGTRCFPAVAAILKAREPGVLLLCTARRCHHQPRMRISWVAIALQNFDQIPCFQEAAPSCLLRKWIPAMEQPPLLRLFPVTWRGHSFGGPHSTDLTQWPDIVVVTATFVTRTAVVQCRSRCSFCHALFDTTIASYNVLPLDLEPWIRVYSVSVVGQGE